MARAARSVVSTSGNIAAKGVEGVIRSVEDFLGRCKDVASIVFADGGPAVEKWGV